MYGRCLIHNLVRKNYKQKKKERLAVPFFGRSEVIRTPEGPPPSHGRLTPLLTPCRDTPCFGRRHFLKRLHRSLLTRSPLVPNWFVPQKGEGSKRRTEDRKTETDKPSLFFYGRSEVIRTPDLLVPNQALYQAEPHPGTVAVFTTVVLYQIFALLSIGFTKITEFSKKL